MNADLTLLINSDGFCFWINFSWNKLEKKYIYIYMYIYVSLLWFLESIGAIWSKPRCSDLKLTIHGWLPWCMSAKPSFIFLGFTSFNFRWFNIFQGILSLPHFQMSILQSLEIHSSLPFKVSWQPRWEWWLNRMRTRIMEGVLLGHRFPLNGCLGFAILHCNCCVREVDCL